MHASQKLSALTSPYQMLIIAGTQDDRGNSGQPADQGRSGGQGMGRGGRKGYSDMRQARQFKDMNKAAIGNHHRKDRALKKTGGPAM